MRAFLVAVLLLAACKGSGCTPGDFIAVCQASCGEKGMAIALSAQNVCVCREVAR